MDTIALKQYIYVNKKIETILHAIGCGSITYHPNKSYYSCSNYNGDNPNAITVRDNEYLSVVNYTRQREFDANADIITLVQYNKQYTFHKAVKYLHGLLGLPYKWIRKQQVKDREDPLELFKKVQCKSVVDVNEIHTLNENALDIYVPLLHIDWLREGIMPRVAERFGLAYSYKRNRVIIPMRYWLTGELMGINARTTVANYQELGIKKYFLTPSYQKSLNLYGLYENYDSIQQAKHVVVFESEKSVLKRASLQRQTGVWDETGVALSGHTISDEQVRILSGLNVEIVIAFDNDVSIDEIRFACDKFYGIRTVSYIHDRWDLLKGKDSPADAIDKIYHFLFNYRVPYDSNEHRQYLESIKSR